MIRQTSTASMQPESYSEVHCLCTVWHFLSVFPYSNETASWVTLRTERLIHFFGCFFWVYNLQWQCSALLRGPTIGTKARESSKLVADILTAAFLLTSSRYVCTYRIRHTVEYWGIRQGRTVAKLKIYFVLHHLIPFLAKINLMLFQYLNSNLLLFSFIFQKSKSAYYTLWNFPP